MCAKCGNPNIETHCKLGSVQQLAARVGLKRPPCRPWRANLNLGTSQSVAAPAELSGLFRVEQIGATVKSHFPLLPGVGHRVTATKTSDSACYARDKRGHFDQTLPSNSASSVKYPRPSWRAPCPSPGQGISIVKVAIC